VSLFFFQFGPYDTIFSVAGLITLCTGLGVALGVRSLPSAPSTQQSKQEEAL